MDKLKNYQQVLQKKSVVCPIKEELVMKYMPLVKYVVGRIAHRLPSHVSYEDLISAGIIGLIDAIKKYDPSKNIEFKTYAYYRIKGAILDELRAMDWMPRSMRKKAKTIEDTYHKLEKKLGRQANDEEVASELGIECDEFYKLLEECKNMVILTAEEIENYIAEDWTLHLLEIKEILALAIKTLSEKEKMVISMYYYDQLTMKEIGYVLGLSESRISQIHTKAILKLRAKLKQDLKINDK